MSLCSWSAQCSYCFLSVVRVIQPVGLPVILSSSSYSEFSQIQGHEHLGSWETFMCYCLAHTLPIFGCCFLVIKELFIPTSTESAFIQVNERFQNETIVRRGCCLSSYSDLSVGQSELFRIWIKHMCTLFCTWILIRVDKANVCLVSQVENNVPELPFFSLERICWIEQNRPSIYLFYN